MLGGNKEYLAQTWISCPWPARQMAPADVSSAGNVLWHIPLLHPILQ